MSSTNVPNGLCQDTVGFNHIISHFPTSAVGTWVSMDRQDLINCSSGLSKVMAASHKRGSVSHCFRDLWPRLMPCQDGQVALGKGDSKKVVVIRVAHPSTDWQHLVTSCWPQDDFQLPAAKMLHIMFVALTSIATAQDAAVCSVVQVALVWCSSEIRRDSQPALAFRHHT